MSTRNEGGVQYRVPGAAFWPSPSQMIVRFLSTLHEASLSVRVLIQASRLLGASENQTRVALSRLMAQGKVARDQRGRYRLDTRAQAWNMRTRVWRELQMTSTSWDGSWVAVYVAELGRSNRRANRIRERAMRAWGFRLFSRGLFVRPANLTFGLDEMKGRLVDLGLESEAKVLLIKEFTQMDTAAARALWDVERLHAEYEHYLRELEQSLARMEKQTFDEKQVEVFILGNVVIGALTMDPYLPSELCNVALREQLQMKMVEYDRLGREIWNVFNQSLGGPDPVAELSREIASKVGPHNS
jgi:phenylacetic acid degradation operon negative regulatory protein